MTNLVKLTQSTNKLIEDNKTTTVVKAHTQTVSEHFTVYYPEHPPRENDPHYHLFNSARRRILAAGVGCWICGCHENLELHHAILEFAVASGVDYEKLSADHPEYHITDEESFLAWVEGPGNLLVLCKDHHRSPYCGIHHVDYPSWETQKYWRKDQPAFLSKAP
jgi:hypothetical protein